MFGHALGPPESGPMVHYTYSVENFLGTSKHYHQNQELIKIYIITNKSSEWSSSYLDHLHFIGNYMSKRHYEVPDTWPYNWVGRMRLDLIVDLGLYSNNAR